MKAFTVYSHPTRGYEGVKHGFSWPAFFFGIFWMLAKRLWSQAGLWLLIYVCFSIIEKVVDAANSEPAGQVLAYLILVAGYFALWLIPAFKGNSWRTSNLSRRGYERVREVRAETPDAALAYVARAAQQSNATASNGPQG